MMVHCGVVGLEEGRPFLGEGRGLHSSCIFVLFLRIFIIIFGDFQSIHYDDEVIRSKSLDN